jgi:prepilin-type N-terminal cleavage/methylation domain-containing protein
MRARLRSESGFSLVELLTTMVLMGILIPGLALMLTTTIHWTSGTQDEATLQTEVRGSIDRMSAEIRQVYSGDTTWPISSVTPTTGTYFMFLTPDRTTPGTDGSDPFHVLKVQYRLNGDKLQRASWTSIETTPNATAPTWTFPGTTAAWTTVLSGFRNTDVFKFLDVNGAVTTTPGSVREVDLKVVVGTSTSQGRTFTYKTTATPRLEP